MLRTLLAGAYSVVGRLERAQKQSLELVGLAVVHLGEDGHIGVENLEGGVLFDGHGGVGSIVGAEEGFIIDALFVDALDWRLRRQLNWCKEADSHLGKIVELMRPKLRTTGGLFE